jgi:hypothetical protein
MAQLPETIPRGESCCSIFRGATLLHRMACNHSYHYCIVVLMACSFWAHLQAMPNMAPATHILSWSSQINEAQNARPRAHTHPRPHRSKCDRTMEEGRMGGFEYLVLKTLLLSSIRGSAAPTHIFASLPFLLRLSAPDAQYA